MTDNNETRIKIFIDNKGDKYNYCNPFYVKHPKGRVLIKEILFENPSEKDTYCLAKIVFDGNECLAFRWNITGDEKNEKKNTNEVCIGYPFSPKKEPQWVCLPNITKYFEMLLLKK